jgi:hypothetical protein
MTVAPSLSVGERLPPLTRTLSQDKMDRFEALGRSLRSSGQDQSPPVNMHTDAGRARSMGFAGPIASGQMSFAYLHELLARQFGDNFLWGGRLVVTFLKPVMAGDTVTAQGAVRERRSAGGRSIYVLDVWLENQRGEKTAAGESQVTVPTPLRE